MNYLYISDADYTANSIFTHLNV